MSKGTVDQPDKIGSLYGRRSDHPLKRYPQSEGQTDLSGLLAKASKNSFVRKPFLAAIADLGNKHVSIRNCVNNDIIKFDRTAHLSTASTNFSFESISGNTAFDRKLKDIRLHKGNLQFHLIDHPAKEHQENLSHNITGHSMTRGGPAIDTGEISIDYNQLKPLQIKNFNHAMIRFVIPYQEEHPQKESSIDESMAPVKRAATKKKISKTKITKTPKQKITDRDRREIADLEMAIDQVFSDENDLIVPPIRSDDEENAVKPLKKKIKLVRAPEVKEDFPENGTGLKIDLDDSYFDDRREQLPSEHEKEKEDEDEPNIDEQIHHRIVPEIVAEAIASGTDKFIYPETPPIYFSEFLIKEKHRAEIYGKSAKDISGRKQPPGEDDSNIRFLNSQNDLRPQMVAPDFMENADRTKRDWTSDVDSALRCLMGELGEFNNSTFEHMIKAWQNGYKSYFSRSLSEIKCPYVWVDEHSMNKSSDDTENTYISVFGADLSGQKRLLSLTEKKSDKSEEWKKVLKDLEKRDLNNPKLFIAACDSPIWEHLPALFPRAEIQYCWNSVINEILRKMSAATGKIALQYLDNIRKAENVELALDSIEKFKAAFGEKYPVAVSEILKYRHGLFTYMKYPVKHWSSIKSVGFIQKHFPAENLMATVLKSEKFRPFSVYIVFNYILRSERNWKRIKSTRLLRQVYHGKRFGTIKNTGIRSRHDTEIAGRSIIVRIVARINESLSSLGTVIKNAYGIFRGKKDNMARTLNAPVIKSMAACLENMPNTIGLTKNLIDRWQKKKPIKSKINKDAVTEYRPDSRKQFNIKNAKTVQAASRPLSGLERELINDLNLEKKHFHHKRTKWQKS